MEVKVWDIIKLNKYATSPKYTYLVLGLSVEAKMEWGDIKREDWYIRIQNLTRLLEWYNEESIISNRSVSKILINI
jgi:hypothetical protein